jgi:hypothetical protein
MSRNKIYKQSIWNRSSCASTTACVLLLLESKLNLNLVFFCIQLNVVVEYLTYWIIVLSLMGYHSPQSPFIIWVTNGTKPTPNQLEAFLCLFDCCAASSITQLCVAISDILQGCDKYAFTIFCLCHFSTYYSLCMIADFLFLCRVMRWMHLALAPTWLHAMHRQRLVVSSN